MYALLASKFMECKRRRRNNKALKIQLAWMVTFVSVCFGLRHALPCGIYFFIFKKNGTRGVCPPLIDPNLFRGLYFTNACDPYLLQPY